MASAVRYQGGAVFRKPIFHSVALHGLLVLLFALFVFSKDVPSALSTDRSIEIQIQDVHVHHHDQKHQVNLSPAHVKTHHRVEEAAPAADTVTEAPPASTPSAPASSAWEGIESSKKNEYLSKLLRIISSRQHYPRAAILNEEQGVVELKVSLDGQGKIVHTEITKSSRYPRLDSAAIATLQEIGRLPLPAEGMSGLTLVIPIRYEINPND